MTEETKKQRQAEATMALDEVQAAIYESLKPLGFKKHGRVFHRFVDEDISQVVELQRGQAYLDATHLFWVCVGIRVPECQLRTFMPQEKPKKYYHEYECNLRWTVGEKSKKKTGEYNLRKPIAPIIEDIRSRLHTAVLPMFEELKSRDAILNKRMDYPQLWPVHMFLLDKAMIFGRRGDMQKASELFNTYYCEAEKVSTRDVARAHQESLRELAAHLGIVINDDTPEA